jgi:hypothetical protein
MQCSFARIHLVVAVPDSYWISHYAGLQVRCFGVSSPCIHPRFLAENSQAEIVAAVCVNEYNSFVPRVAGVCGPLAMPGETT